MRALLMTSCLDPVNKFGFSFISHRVLHFNLKQTRLGQSLRNRSPGKSVKMEPYVRKTKSKLNRSFLQLFSHTQN